MDNYSIEKLKNNFNENNSKYINLKYKSIYKFNKSRFFGLDWGSELNMLDFVINEKEITIFYLEFLHVKKHNEGIDDFEDELIKFLTSYHIYLNEKKRKYPVELSQRKKVFIKETKNPYTDIFKGDNNTNFLIFKTYTQKHIIDRYADYSFLFQKMIKENRLHKVRHLNFMEWLKTNQFISENVYDEFISKGVFSTKYNSAQRENNYYNVINDLLK